MDFEMQKLKPHDTLKIVKDGIEYEFEVAEEGGYVVSVPDLPGCVSQGDTFEEAWEMIQDAMEGWLEVAVSNNDPIPVKLRRLIGNSGQSRNG